MLNRIPEAINRAVRNTVIRHPNSFDCQIVRKAINRTAPDEVGGLPTLGGLGVISADDEQDVSWEFVGNGYALSADMFSPSQMMDRQDANNRDGDEFRFLIEPEEPGAATPEKNDVIYLVISEAVRIAFEIVAIETTSNIPPYTQRYVCNKRPDLSIELP